MGMGAGQRWDYGFYVGSESRPAVTIAEARTVRLLLFGLVL